MVEERTSRLSEFEYDEFGEEDVIVGDGGDVAIDSERSKVVCGCNILQLI